MATNTKDEKEIEESKAPLISHLIELRDRLKWAVVAFFIAFLVSYFFKEYIYGFLVKPLAEIYQEMGVENPRMIVTAKGMKKNRKYAVVGAFGSAALLTPPDIISQVGLGIPIIILYEISIYLAVMMEKKRQEKEVSEKNAEENKEETDLDDIPETDYGEED